MWRLCTGAAQNKRRCSRPLAVGERRLRRARPRSLLLPLTPRFLLQDATFEFERRRNRPERYDREVMGATLKAMKRVGEIRERREVRHLEGRFAGKAARELAADKEELGKDIHLIRAPDSLLAGAVGGEEEAIPPGTQIRDLGREWQVTPTREAVVVERLSQAEQVELLFMAEQAEHAR